MWLLLHEVNDDLQFCVYEAWKTISQGTADSYKKHQWHKTAVIITHNGFDHISCVVPLTKHVCTFGLHIVFINSHYLYNMQYERFSPEKPAFKKSSIKTNKLTGHKFIESLSG